MALLIDGDKVVSSTPTKSLGEDERQLLDALHGTGPLGEKLKKDLEKQKNRAKYKIEIQFHKDRRAALHTPSLVSIMVWESGRRLHGGGDQRMVFCGYWEGQGYRDADACGKPIKDDNFAANHLVCPHCKRECFLDAQVKKAHILLAQKEGKDTSNLKRMPVVNPYFIAKMSPKPLANFIAKIFRNLDSNADIYVKYHPTDIRSHDASEAKKPDIYDKARLDRIERKENRGLVIYPNEHIIRDTVAGATVESRFLALLLA